MEEIGDGGEGRRARRARGVYRKLENYYQIHVGLASSLCSETRFSQWSGSLSKSILLFITSPLSVCVRVCEREGVVCVRVRVPISVCLSLSLCPPLSLLSFFSSLHTSAWKYRHLS